VYLQNVWRQDAGRVIAAAGLITLRKSPSRLHIDHENAHLWPKDWRRFSIENRSDEITNQHRDLRLFTTGKTAVEFCRSYTHGVWAQDTALHSVRFVTHCDVNGVGIDELTLFARLQRTPGKPGMKITAVCGI
jgi:threonine aldolase